MGRPPPQTLGAVPQCSLSLRPWTSQYKIPQLIRPKHRCSTVERSPPTLLHPCCHSPTIIRLKPFYCSLCLPFRSAVPPLQEILLRSNVPSIFLKSACSYNFFCATFDHYKPILHVVCAGALRRVKPIHRDICH